MKLKNIRLVGFKRFKDFSINEIPETAKLVLLVGPNGSGKTSVFEAFNYWIRSINRILGRDIEYYTRDEHQDMQGENLKYLFNKISISFHNSVEKFEFFHPSNDGHSLKIFYIRSAYRNEPDFTSNGLSQIEDALSVKNSPEKLIQGETRVSDNYRRIVNQSIQTLYDPSQREKSAYEITEHIIGKLRTSIRNVFSDLELEGPGMPLRGGTFRFTKGTAKNFHYKNLSAGEKSAFDILLDFIIKKEVFDDTIYCIDEPELHMHTQLQAKLLREIFSLIPQNSQLWIATHSIGMARAAFELYNRMNNEVVFLDFHDKNFDIPTEIRPTVPDRSFWKRLFNTTLDDLSQLILPENIIFCEGKKLGSGGRKPSFDTTIYKQIFSNFSAKVEFLPLGGFSEVESDGEKFSALIKVLAPGIKSWAIFDRDDRSTTEIDNLNKSNIIVLPLRDIESYLWADDVIQALCASKASVEKSSIILQHKQSLLNQLLTNGKPIDDIKEISRNLYNFTKQTLQLTGCGNDAEAFAISTLAPLIKPGLHTYEELKAIVLAPLNM